MGNRLSGKNAVVTGAGRGIGRAIALALAEEGANVVVCKLKATGDWTAADKSPADEVVEQCRDLGVRAVPYYGDVADFRTAEEIVRTCVDTFGTIDILCNIAGIQKSGMIFGISEEDWDRVVAVHLKGTFNLLRHATPFMRQHRYGRILNCVSDAMVGLAGNSHYVAAKGGIASLTYATALDMKKYGVTCNAISPGGATRMSLSPESLAAYRKWVEAGIWTEKQYEDAIHVPPPEHMGMIAVFLCSDAAAHITGCIFGAMGHRLSYWTPPVESVVFARDWEKEGRWTWEEVEKHMHTLLRQYVSPAQS